MISAVDVKKAAIDEGFDRIIDDGSALQLTATHDPLKIAVRPFEGGVSLEVSAPHVRTVLATEFELAGVLDFFKVQDRHQLHRFLRTALRLSRSLPSAPLMAFMSKTANMPSSTEVERMAVQRVGQDIFRKALMDFWDGRCPLTGISDPALLRASHIVPWAKCVSDEERLDVYNGLLLSSLFDAAFDAKLITFNDDGRMLMSPKLSEKAYELLYYSGRLSLHDNHNTYIKRHKEIYESYNS